MHTLLHQIYLNGYKQNHPQNHFPSSVNRIWRGLCPLTHSVHLKTESKNHTENKPNRTDFFVFMVSGFGMVWTFHTDLNFGFYGIYRKTEWLTE